MATGDTETIDSAVNSAGETLSLLQKTVFENTHTYYSLYSEKYITGTDYIQDLDLIVDGTSYSLVDWGIESIPSSNSIDWYYAEGTIFNEADWPLYMDQFAAPFSDDSIGIRLEYGKGTDFGYDPHEYGDRYEYDEISTIWDAKYGLLGDDEWRGSYATWTDIDYLNHEDFFVTRWVGGGTEKIYLWEEGERYYEDDFDGIESWPLEIDQLPLNDGSYLVGTIFEHFYYGSYTPEAGEVESDEIRLQRVDWDGNVDTYSMSIAFDTAETADGQIIEAADGSAVYVASYEPLGGVYGGADGLRTDFVFVTDDGFAPLTLIGLDLRADDVTAVSLSSDRQTATITYLDAGGESQTGDFQTNWRAGTLSNLPDRHVGTAGDDVMVLSDISEKIWAGAGDDYIDSMNGNDTIFGGTGADTFVLNSGPGTDRIKDFSLGEGDQLEVSALTGTGIRVAVVNENYNGQGARLGLSVTDLDSGRLLVDLRGNLSAEDVATNGFTGVRGADGGRDFWAGAVLENEGAARLYGTTGADIITTEAGQRIYADAGADVIIVEGSADLSGGAGEDLFIFRDANARIRDFDIGVDILDLSDWGVESLEDLTLNVRTTGKGVETGDLLISDGSHTLRLDGTLASELSDSDFIFA